MNLVILMGSGLELYGLFVFYGCGYLELSSMVAVPWLGSIVIHALGVCFGVMQINLCHDCTFIRWNHLSISVEL